jgi:hypothetical protein
MGMRLRAPWPSPLAGLALGVTAAAILATIFMFRPHPAPDHCTDARARIVALERFRADPTARVSMLLHYARARSVFIRTDGDAQPAVVGVECVAGEWMISRVYR